MKLIIQIPCLNEEKTLEITYKNLPKYIDGIDEIEYLLINDGSTDNSVKVAKNLGFNYVVNFKQNKGLAKGFMAGLDACLYLGADIIVNTDADNQYCGEDIEKLIKPILNGEADMVIGERAIDQIEYFSKKKKFFQHLGSWVVRMVSGTNITDAPSGFRAYSREAALRLNVTNEYTYTIETIIQAGHEKIAIAYVPIRTNEMTRTSRLFNNMWQYIKCSSFVICRSFIMYKPLKFFLILGIIMLLIGIGIGIKFFVFLSHNFGNEYIQSFILMAIFIILGFQSIITGLLADVVTANRKILEDIQYRIRKMDCKNEKDNYK